MYKMRYFYDYESLDRFLVKLQDLGIDFAVDYLDDDEREVLGAQDFEVCAVVNYCDNPVMLYKCVDDRTPRTEI